MIHKSLSDNYLKSIYKDELISIRKKLLAKKIEEAVLIILKENKDVDFVTELLKRTNYSYNYISNIYSEVRKKNLRRFIIEQRVHLIKQFILQDKHTLGEIARKLKYKNLSHMSTQFKAVAGVSPSLYLAAVNK